MIIAESVCQDVDKNSEILVVALVISKGFAVLMVIVESVY